MAKETLLEGLISTHRIITNLSSFMEHSSILGVEAAEAAECMEWLEWSSSDLAKQIEKNGEVLSSDLSR